MQRPPQAQRSISLSQNDHHSTAPSMHQSTPIRFNDHRERQQRQAQDRNFTAPFGNGGTESVAGGMTQGSGRLKKQSLLKGMKLWPEGQSFVGRKGTDGEWEEMRCTVM